MPLSSSAEPFTMESALASRSGFEGAGVETETLMGASFLEGFFFDAFDSVCMGRLFIVADMVADRAVFSVYVCVLKWLWRKCRVCGVGMRGWRWVNRKGIALKASQISVEYWIELNLYSKRIVEIINYVKELRTESIVGWHEGGRRGRRSGRRWKMEARGGSSDYSKLGWSGCPVAST